MCWNLHPLGARNCACAPQLTDAHISDATIEPVIALVPRNSLMHTYLMQMDDFFQHPNIQIFYMKKLKPKKAKYASSEAVSTASVHPGSTPLAEAADSLSEHDDDHGGLSPAPKQMADGQGGLEAVVRQTEGLSIHTP
eukprot:364426-Chlamydomonas_euryale.AAC.30